MGNPLLQQVMAGLQARATQPGGGPGPSGSPSGGGSDSRPDAGDQYTSMVSDLRGADPGQLRRQVMQIKSIMAVMMVQNLERFPNVAGKISKIIPQFDGVLKEIDQVQNVKNAVGEAGTPPIQMGAAQLSPQPGSAPEAAAL